jgi:hypothetical protein
MHSGGFSVNLYRRPWSLKPESTRSCDAIATHNPRLRQLGLPTTGPAAVRPSELQRRIRVPVRVEATCRRRRKGGEAPVSFRRRLRDREVLRVKTRRMACSISKYCEKLETNGERLEAHSVSLREALHVLVVLDVIVTAFDVNSKHIERD